MTTADDDATPTFGGLRLVDYANLCERRKRRPAPDTATWIDLDLPLAPFEGRVGAPKRDPAG